MWVITELGEMYSAVDSKDHSKKVVRMRDRRSADNFEEFVNAVRDGKGEEVEILEGAGTDYEFRVICEREEWENFLLDRAERATATNVKNAVAANLGGGASARAFVNAMADTWVVWYRYQEDEKAWG